MADSTVALKSITLFDRWPTRPNALANSIIGGNGGLYGAPDSYSQNVATPPSGLNVGDKMTGRNDGTIGTPGEWTLTYLKFGTALSGTTYTAPTFTLGTTIGAGHLCVPVSATAGIPDFIVSNAANAANKMLNGPVAVAIGPMTDNCYGWFWTGGPAPDFLVKTLASAAYRTNTTATTTYNTDITATTDGNVAADSGLAAIAAAGTTLATQTHRAQYAAVFGLNVTLTPGCGYAYAADA